jgi:hypothetical protein
MDFESNTIEFFEVSGHFRSGRVEFRALISLGHLGFWVVLSPAETGRVLFYYVLFQIGSGQISGCQTSNFFF